MNSSITPDWIGVDWGTSNLRAFAMSWTQGVIAKASSTQGMATLEPHQFEEALLSLIQAWLRDDRVTSVYACGMVGAKQGWVEAQYRSVPCQPVSGQGLTKVPTASARIQVSILPGLSQDKPADVMRGEETQLAGIQQAGQSQTATICMPGTHCKWVSMSDGIVHSFRTFMTGELFSLLSEQSVLRHGMNSDSWDMQALLDSARLAIEEPVSVASRLFSLRANGLLHGLEPETARSMLSGLLIGQELGAVRELWDSQSVIIIGATQLSSLYADTLTESGAAVQQVDASKATIAGLSRVANQARGQHS